VFSRALRMKALHTFRRGVPAGDEAPDDASGDTVLAESTGGLARAVEAGITLPLRSCTWKLALTRRPARYHE